MLLPQPKQQKDSSLQVINHIGYFQTLQSQQGFLGLDLRYECQPTVQSNCQILKRDEWFDMGYPLQSSEMLWQSISKSPVRFKLRG